jgi:S1/P1 Nuclease
MTASRLAAAAALACLAATPALGWSKAGHMLTAAIAADDLAKEPATLDALAQILDKHPDRAAFQVAAGQATGAERTRRLLMECARWPDDMRGTPFDHPTWHYQDVAVLGEGAPADMPKGATGEAVAALTLAAMEATDAHAPAADRAMALCWVMHLTGDIHQPLHAASLFSSTYPQGDAGGNSQYVTDTDGKTVVSLHWYWDQRPNKSEDPRVIAKLAGDLEARYPRSGLSEIDPAKPRDFAHWALDESHALAVSSAYAPGLKTGTTSALPPMVPADYDKTAGEVTERRITLASYRLADLLRAIAAIPLAKDAK